MSTYEPLSGWVYRLLFCSLALSTACSSATDSSSSSAGAASGGSASGGSASAGSAGSSAGAATSAGSAAGGVSGSTQAGAGGNTQAGGSTAGGSSGGAVGNGSGGSSAGGTAGSAGASASGAGGASTGGSAGASSGGFSLTSPGWTAMAGCSAENKAMCPVFPKDNIGTSIGGANKSPELNWTAGPTGTQSYAIVLQDLSNIMGGKPFVHWAMWNIPAATHTLPAGLETTAMPSVPAGSSQKSYAGNGYQGSGKCGNVYEFVLYALPTASFTPSANTQTAARDGLAATNAPSATLRARSGAPGCTE